MEAYYKRLNQQGYHREQIMAEFTSIKAEFMFKAEQIYPVIPIYFLGKVDAVINIKRVYCVRNWPCVRISRFAGFSASRLVK